VSPGSSQGAEDVQAIKSNKTSVWQQPKQISQPPPQALTVSFPYQSQQTSQHNLMQQHNEVPRNQVSQTQSVFDNSKLTCQNGMQHHSQPVPTNSSAISSSYGPQIQSFPSRPAQIHFQHSSSRANLTVSDNIGGGYPSSHQSYGVKLRQPPFTPWQEESPPLPPSWWYGDRQSSAGGSQQDETVAPQPPGTSVNLQFPALNYLQGNILQQPINSPTDLVSEDLYNNTNWHSGHHRSAPPAPLNLNQNLQHHLMSGASPQLPSNFTSPTATQASVSRPLARSNARFQGPQKRPDASHLSVFTSVRNQEPQRLNAEVKYYCV
jgi:hypothetical protein